MHGVLADHRIDDEENFIGVDGITDVARLLHEVFVDCEAASRVDDHDVMELLFRVPDAISGDLHRIADAVARLRRVGSDARPLTDNLQLVDGVGALEVRSNEKRRVPLRLEVLRKLAGERGLSGAL